jgi:phosphate transport system permease protein
MMNDLVVVGALLLFASLAYQVGLLRSRSLLVAGGGVRLNSRPGYHGARTILYAVVPAAIVYFVWSFVGNSVVHSLVLGSISPELMPAAANERLVLLRQIANVASGAIDPGSVPPHVTESAQRMRLYELRGQVIVLAAMAALAAGGLFLSWRNTTAESRARSSVERATMVALFLCAAVAILTTLGIVLSLLGESVNFFSMVNPADFFFGTVWNPRFASVGSGGQGEFGILPLLAGTLMITGIAMSIAIPLGLMSAIYLSEYAGHSLRAWAKPIIEVLAGIPTVVYGVFALVTVGPLISAAAATFGLEVRATSALTAGVVMGIMIVPFVSSLSDDIITQVPQAMRDGSLALGATRSETVWRVVLPAALPGIVGAFLLAVSKAIGETMIVVLAAGNAPVLTANPFDSVSTITVGIVNQLTGDADFSSPQSLVGFALGLTLFGITLMLNIVALAVVRRYREQYE